VQVHVFVGGVEEKLMANKAIKQVIEVMQTSQPKMGRCQDIIRCHSRPSLLTLLSSRRQTCCDRFS
jgi:hypothetical protein